MKVTKDSDLDLDVMVIGGRRCGKTSVLAAMQSSFDNAMRDTPLTIVPADDVSLRDLTKKKEEANTFFLNRLRQPSFTTDHEIGTKEQTTYSFDVGLNGKKSRIRVNFADYPGEWLDDPIDIEHEKALAKMMQKSRILVIAIDTPYLMEEKGQYNEERNVCSKITSLIVKTKFADPARGPQLVLFVPLKCERYYNERRMDEVSARVRESYGQLIQNLEKPSSDGMRSKTTLVIAPILTLGGAAFSRFGRNEDGTYEMHEQYHFPCKELFNFPDRSVDKPDPMYCEQPILYILHHVLKQAAAARDLGKTGWKLLDVLGAWWQETVLKWPAAGDYLDQGETIRERMKRHGDGYTVLSDAR
ncbi:MAG: hypothetical protein HDQ87_09125 [Clostridia bacterium]|nr:hypothetical protein [Clostridia bacterium]